MHRPCLVTGAEGVVEFPRAIVGVQGEQCPVVLAPAILLRSVDNWHEQESVLGDKLRQAHMCIIMHGWGMVVSRQMKNTCLVKKLQGYAYQEQEVKDVGCATQRVCQVGISHVLVL